MTFLLFFSFSNNIYKICFNKNFFMVCFFTNINIINFLRHFALSNRDFFYALRYTKIFLHIYATTYLQNKLHNIIYYLFISSCKTVLAFNTSVYFLSNFVQQDKIVFLSWYNLKKRHRLTFNLCNFTSNMLLHFHYQ